MTTTESPAAPTGTPERTTTWSTRLRRGLSFSSIGGIYVLLLAIVVFSIWVPDTFPHFATVRQVLNNNAISAMAGLTLVVPLAAGVFDISVPYTMTLSGVICTYSIVHNDMPLVLAVVLALLAALVIGVVNGLTVVTFKIDSLIGTLATGFLVQAVVKWRTGSRNVTDPKLSGTFTDIARGQLGIGKDYALTLPVFYVVAIALALWYVLEHTATGRRVYATGFNRDAARLATVQTERLRFGCLIASSLLAGITGIVLASSIGSGSPTGGNTYLLPAFAAVFLGATQLKSGRFNAWGTIIAVILLGTGTTGLGLAKQSQWVQDTFTGVVLIASLAVTGFQVRRAGAETRRLARARLKSSGQPGGGEA
jgi:ribose/xylose/arabinose/galactoside ABC-type transport system permease subunit